MKYRGLYPENWEELAYACKERAGWQCKGCHIFRGDQRVSERTGVVYIVYLAAAHLDHDPWNPAPRLAALCPTCHAQYDYSWDQRQRWLALEVYRHQLLVNGYLLNSEQT